MFVNNAIYGMTGGQMAPTTLVGQRTSSTPTGRDPALAGRPIRISEMLATLEAPVYIARTSVHNPAAIKKAGAAIRRAFACQKEELGFALVEVLSTCPTNWGLKPRDAMTWLETQMIPHYPLGEFRLTPEAAAL